MAYQRLKCAATSHASKSNEVSLAEFASTGGLTETEYSNRLFEKLQAGDMMDLLNIDGQCLLGDWIAERFLNGDAYFSVVFKMSSNRVRDVALHCICVMEMMKDEPKVYVRHALPGFSDKVPTEAEGLQSIELSFELMESRI